MSGAKTLRSNRCRTWDKSWFDNRSIKDKWLYGYHGHTKQGDTMEREIFWYYITGTRISWRRKILLQFIFHLFPEVSWHWLGVIVRVWPVWWALAINVTREYVNLLRRNTTSFIEIPSQNSDDLIVKQRFDDGARALLLVHMPKPMPRSFVLHVFAGWMW